MHLMIELIRAIPDPDALLALEPEELGAKLLFLVRQRDGAKMFHPDSYANELNGQGRWAGGLPALSSS